MESNTRIKETNRFLAYEFKNISPCALAVEIQRISPRLAVSFWSSEPEIYEPVRRVENASLSRQRSIWDSSPILVMTARREARSRTRAQVATKYLAPCWSLQLVVQAVEAFPKLSIVFMAADSRRGVCLGDRRIGLLERRHSRVARHAILYEQIRSSCVRNKKLVCITSARTMVRCNNQLALGPKFRRAHLTHPSC